ncbi:hypothetical protein BGZ63DRAFT_470975 [Mariannaea sp. PMI_226]|nr:hypothetical protein BGZ63DRAFT_470975 [Mariannaea sp. PMI_226]
MKTRYDVSLDTATPPISDEVENPNYFDQVTALSQGIINASFRQLFDSVEGVAEIAHKSKLLGRFDAVLDAPSIMINGMTTNATEVMYVLRIKSGKFNFIDNKEREIHDWVLALPTKVNELSMDESPGDSANAKARKKRWLTRLKKNFPGFVPGDYSAQRIFCALGSAGWNDPDDKNSTVWDPVTKATMNFREFMNRQDNVIYKDIMVSLLKGWATSEGEDAVGTMGIKFTLPEKQGPVHIYNQVYPYLKNDQDRGGMSMGDYSMSARSLKEPYGKLEDGDYNCLLYCENVEAASGEKETITVDGVQKLVDKVKVRPLPTVNLKLNHNGNLAEPGGYYGAFVMDHRIFMKSFLLPQLQELCLATYMQIGLPERKYNPVDNSGWIYPKYAIGCELEGKDKEARPASDPEFKLKRIGDSKYLWSKESAKHGLKDVYSFARPETPGNYFSHNNYDIVANSSVEVFWEAGSPRMTIKGEIVSEDMKVKFEDFHYKCTGTWSIALVLNNVERTFFVDGRTVTTRVLMPEVEGGLARGIGVVISNIEKRFQVSGQLSYPGHGELEYSEPKFTRWGSIIAKVNFKPPTGPNNSMFFPPKAKQEDYIMEEPSAPDPKTDTFEATLKHNAEPLLTWTMHFKYNEKTRVGRLTLEATNNMKDTNGKGIDLAFSSITVSLEHTPNTGADGKTRNPKLFSDDGWRADHDSILDNIYDSGKAFVTVWTKFWSREPETPPEQPKAPSEDVKKIESTAPPVDGPKDAAAVTEPASGDAKPPASEDKKGSEVVAPVAATTDEKPKADASQNVQTDIATPAPAQGVTGVEAPSTTPTADPATQSPATQPTPSAEPEKWHLVERIKETVEEQKGNVYEFKRDWDINEELPDEWFGATSEVNLDISTSQVDRSLKFTVEPVNAEGREDDDAPKGFVIPKNGKFRLVCQGDVAELGHYAIKVQEEWMKMEQGTLREGRYAIDWKMVDLKKNASGKVETDWYDVSDRLAEEAKRRADAEAAKAKAAAAAAGAQK